MSCKIVIFLNDKGYKWRVTFFSFYHFSLKVEKISRTRKCLHYNPDRFRFIYFYLSMKIKHGQ